MVTSERRNFASRAEAGRLVLNALLGARPDGAIGDLQAWILPPGATDRILTRFAFRGLARLRSCGWEPTPPLLSRVPLLPCDASC